MDEQQEIELTGEDDFAIDVATTVARHFLGHASIQPRQIIGLGNALCALKRLPMRTPGAFVEFGIVYRAGDSDFSEMKYIDFQITESDLEISRGGSVYDKAVGSDSFTLPGWRVGASGNSEKECDLYNLEEEILEYLNLGAKISVTDESNIDYDEYE